MDKTSLFENTFSAREVAEAGYNAMLEGKLDIIAGVTTVQRVMMGAVPFTPKKMMKQIRQMQEVKSWSGCRLVLVTGAGSSTAQPTQA